jgi:predicted GNAT family N-acyltransferase
VTVVAAAEARAADWPEIVALRFRVFVEEQGVPVEVEQDHLDAVAVHAVARTPDGRLVGTGRAVLDAEGPGIARIGRMAVDAEARGSGVGLAVLRVLETAVHERGGTGVLLHAQDHAVGFYGRAGYEPVGEPFEEAGIGHLAMARALP